MISITTCEITLCTSYEADEEFHIESDANLPSTERKITGIGGLTPKY